MIAPTYFSYDHIIFPQLLVAAAPKAIARKGRCRRSLIEIRAFCQSYNAQLSLVTNNCQSFVDALLEFVLEEEEEDRATAGRGADTDDDGDNDDDDDIDDAASVLGWILDDDD